MLKPRNRAIMKTLHGPKPAERRTVHGMIINGKFVRVEGSMSKTRSGCKYRALLRIWRYLARGK